MIVDLVEWVLILSSYLCTRQATIYYRAVPCWIVY